MVRDLVKPVVQRLNDWYGLPAPTYLGIDECYDSRGRNARLTLVDASTSAVLLVDRDRSWERVAELMRGMRDLDTCRAVCMDFHTGYAKAVRAVKVELGLPAGCWEVVIDKIHARRLAIDGLMGLYHGMPCEEGKSPRLKKSTEVEALHYRAYEYRDQKGQLTEKGAQLNEVFAARPALRR